MGEWGRLLHEGCAAPCTCEGKSAATLKARWPSRRFCSGEGLPPGLRGQPLSATLAPECLTCLPAVPLAPMHS